MRNLRKLTAVVIAIALVLTSMTAAFAASTYSYEAEATVLQDLDIWQGGTNGDLMLGKELTRAEGAVLVLKTVLGKTEADMEAADTAALSTFADAAEVPAWAEGWVALAVKEGVVKGSNNNLNAGEPLLGKDLASMFMNALGFAAENEYGKAVELLAAKSTGTILADIAADITNEALTRDVASALVFDALTTTAKDATKTLIETYIGSNAELRAVAVDAGLVAGTAAIDSATATGVKTITVKFNGPVDTTKAVIKVKKGAAIYGSTVAWNDKKDTATVTTIVNLPAADYTVEVTGLTETALTKTVTFAAETASKVEVTSTTVPLVNSATIEFKVSNQYGEDMKVLGTASGVVVSAYNTTQKRVETLTNLTADNKLTFSPTFQSAASPAKVGDVIRVTVAYAGLTAQSNVTVADPAANSAISFGDIAPLTGKVRISVSETGLAVPYTMFDQYSVATKLAAHTANQDAVADIETISGVQFVSSNPAIVDVDTFAVDADGKLTFNTGATSGTATITAIINTTGAVSKFNVSVNDVAKVDSLAIAAPSALIAAGETVKLDVTAADQFGAAIAAKDITGVAVTSSNTSVVANGSTITAGKLNVVTLAAGTTTLTAKVGDKVVGSVTVVVEAAAKIMQVKSVSFPSKFEVGAAKTMTTDDFAVIDQYGRTIDKANVTFTVAEKTAADAYFTVTTAGAFTADAAGSSVIVLTATYNAENAPAYEFTVTAVASSDVKTYAITAVPTIYSGAAHAKALELVGKTAAGDTVVLKANKVVSAASGDPTKVTVAVAGGVATVTGVADQEGNVVVSLWSESAKLAETTITLSKVAPVITTVKFNDSVETALVATVTLSDNLEVKDQYGVTKADVGFWTTSDSTKATVVNGVVTMQAGATTGDSVTIGYVSSNGIAVTTVLTK